MVSQTSDRCVASLRTVLLLQRVRDQRTNTLIMIVESVFQRQDDLVYMELVCMELRHTISEIAE
jgi:hypothetical protein